MFGNPWSKGYINKSESFFVGDALGRKYDFADSDKMFAKNIGILYFPPEDIFVNNVIPNPKIKIN